MTRFRGGFKGGRLQNFGAWRLDGSSEQGAEKCFDNPAYSRRVSFLDPAKIYFSLFVGQEAHFNRWMRWQIPSAK